MSVFKIIIVGNILLLGFLAQAQNKVNTSLKVYLDCSNGGDCYLNYIREKVPALTYVRDRLVADVHIINLVNYTDAGNEQRILMFIGQKNFQGMNDTLSYSIQSNAQDQERRVEFVNHILIGLVPYITKTSLVNNLSIELKGNDSTAMANDERDPWNLWVNQLGFIAQFDGNRNYATNSINTYLNTSKETDEEKISFYIYGNWQRQKYVVNDTSTLIYNFQDYGFNFSYAKKLNEHWGIGGFAKMTNSLFSNYRHRIAIGPKIEYSIFPYKEFNTRRLIVYYDINPVFNSYYDTTIYLKTKETLFNQSLSIVGSYTKKWGSINLGLLYFNYLNDWRIYFLGLEGAVSTKLAKGFNLTLWGNYNINKSQINLRKGDINVDQLLVRNQEYFSSYSYNLGVGISYRFGSTRNNYVCPAFRGLNYSVNL